MSSAGPGTYEQLEDNGARLALGMRDALMASGGSGLVTQVGPVVHCSPNLAGGDGLSYFRADQTMYDRLVVELLKRGVFALPGGRWYISTAHTADDVDQTVAAFANALLATPTVETR